MAPIPHLIMNAFVAGRWKTWKMSYHDRDGQRFVLDGFWISFTEETITERWIPCNTAEGNKRFFTRNLLKNRVLSDFSESIRLIYRLVKLSLFSVAYFDMLEYYIGNDYLVTAPSAK